MVRTSGRCVPTDRSIRPVLLLLMLASLASACGEPPSDVETQIEAVIEEARGLARSGDARGLAGLLAGDYEDGEGRDRRAMALTIRTLLGRYPHHLLLVDDLQVQVVSSELANARMKVALVGRDGSRPLLYGVDADRLLVDLAFRRSGRDWQVTRASWEPARGKASPYGD